MSCVSEVRGGVDQKKKTHSHKRKLRRKREKKKKRKRKLFRMNYRTNVGMNSGGRGHN